jgi:hypothetical protein
MIRASSSSAVPGGKIPASSKNDESARVTDVVRPSGRRSSIPGGRTGWAGVRPSIRLSRCRRRPTPPASEEATVAERVGDVQGGVDPGGAVQIGVRRSRPRGTALGGARRDSCGHRAGGRPHEALSRLGMQTPVCGPITVSYATARQWAAFSLRRPTHCGARVSGASGPGG